MQNEVDMPVFQELGGSPTEEYTSNGFSAKRLFLVPWEYRDEFVSTVFGDAEKAKTLKYPGRTDVIATKLRIEVFDPSAVNIRELNDLAKDAIDYNGSFAKATVEYRDVASLDREDAPIAEDGTSITYRMVVESEREELAIGGVWRWNDNSVALPSDSVLARWIPQTIHYVTWSKVVNPPWTVVSETQGTVNNSIFLGCEPETLLFEGAEANKLYKTGQGIDDQTETSFTWAIKYKFRERAIKSGGRIYTWNHAYRESDSQWSIPLDGRLNRLYDARDFNALFRVAMPDDIP